jgi:hypothetical protein
MEVSLANVTAFGGHIHTPSFARIQTESWNKHPVAYLETFDGLAMTCISFCQPLHIMQHFKASCCSSSAQRVGTNDSMR